MSTATADRVIIVDNNGSQPFECARILLTPLIILIALV